MERNMSSFGLIRGFRSSDSTAQPLRLDKATNTLPTIDYPHHEIHAGSSFHIFAYNASVGTGGTINIYIKTKSTAPFCHAFGQWSSGGAAIYRIYEAPTITANTGTNGNAIINHNRNLTATVSGCRDNATVPVDNKYGTGVTKTGDGTILLVEYAGVGKAAGGSGRNESEYVLLPDTVYLFEVEAVGNNIALSVSVDFYEHTNIA
jgi:hypothetical protein